jgi:hypothetical protein
LNIGLIYASTPDIIYITSYHSNIHIQKCSS